MIDILERMIDSNIDRITPSDIKNIKSYCNDSRRILKQAQVSAPAYFDYLLQIHGDYNPFNLLYDEEGSVLSTIDYENTALDSPIHDLAEAILDYSFHKYKPVSTNFQYLPKKVDLKKAKSFLDSYFETSPFERDRLYAYLPQALSATFIELFTLGLVRGDYSFNNCENVSKIRKEIVKDISAIL